MDLFTGSTQLNKMFKELKDKLDKYRRDKELWIELAWYKNELIRDYEDINENKRTEVGIALQFDKKVSDEEFIQYLMKEEVKNRSNDPFQGCSGNLNRIGFLLASFRNPQNVELFLEAKTANFDTHCGFDWEHILSAGVKKTFELVETTDKKVKEIFNTYFESLEACELTDDDIENWLTNKKNKWYPNDINKLDTEYNIALALELENYVKAKELIDKLEKESSESEDFLQTLKYYRGRLGDIQSEIILAEKLLNYPKEDDLRAWDFIALSQLYLKLKDIEKAWLKIRRAISMKAILNKGRLGQVADTCIDIINKSDTHYDFYRECYQFGIENLGHFLTMDQAKKRLEASSKMKDSKNVESFEKIYQQEKEKMDTIMNQIKKV